MSRFQLPPGPRRPSHRKTERGFTLMEILTVVVIIAIMFSVAVPLISGYPKGRQLASEADNIAAQIEYARLVAVSSGQPVELRFYLEPVTETQSLGNTEFFRAAQVMVKNEEDIFRPDGRALRFEGTTIILEDDEYSSILAGEPEGPDPNARDVKNLAMAEKKYRAIRFLPGGSTNLGRGADEYWTLTLVNWNPTLSTGGGSVTLGPDGNFPNFVTLQIDPFTAKVRRYEPGR